MRTLTKIIVASIAVVFVAVHWSTIHFDPETLRGARVLVTGASTGIGEQMSYHYARFGAQLVITARRETVLQQVVEKCLSLGAQKALYIAADMATESDPDKVVEFTLGKLGGLDYLVLNHIGPTPFSMWKGDIEHIRWLMKVNFFQLCSDGLESPAIIRAKQRFTGDSFFICKVPGPLTAPYTATKCALNGFFGSLEHELAMKNSNVSLSICTLGLIDTETAMEKIKGIVTNVQAAPASEAALNIIKTGATRQAELYYPYTTYIITLIKDWYPAATNYLIRHIYNYKP